MSQKEQLTAVIDIMQDLQEDSSTSKSLKKVIEDVLKLLKQEGDIRMLCSKALEEFEKISDDSSIDPYMRTQIWNIVSMLENISSS